MSITVSVVAGNDQTGRKIRKTLERSGRLRCLDVFVSAENALEQIPGRRPDVVLVDGELPDMTGDECVARMRKRAPGIELLRVCQREECDAILQSLRAGANGYVMADMSPGQLARAVAEVHAGGAPMSVRILRQLVEQLQRAKVSEGIAQLSVREHEIVALIAEGLRYREIAARLKIAVSTVRAHLHAAYDKLKVRSRTEAAVKFRELRGLNLPIPESLNPTL